MRRFFRPQAGITAFWCPRCRRWVDPAAWFPKAALCCRCIDELHELVRLWSVAQPPLFPPRPPRSHA